jgi:hypothetical protein
MAFRFENLQVWQKGMDLNDQIQYANQDISKG